MEAESTSNGGSASCEKVNYAEAGRTASEFLSQQLLLSGRTTGMEAGLLYVFVWGGNVV